MRDRGIALNFDVRAEAVHFLHMHEAVFKNGFGHARSALRNGIHRHELRLHVGGKTGIFGGAQIDWLRTAVHFRANPVFTGFNLHAHFAQFVQRGVHDARVNVGQANFAAGRGHRTQEGARFNTVGHNLVRYAVQALHAVNHQAMRADAADARAHFDQHIGQIGDFRLTRGVFQNRLSVRQHRRHQQVFRPRDRNHVGGDACATHQAAARTVLTGRLAVFIQNRCLRMDVAVFDIDTRAHRLQAFDVLIDRTRANRAATGQRHPRFAKTRE